MIIIVEDAHEWREQAVQVRRERAI